MGLKAILFDLYGTVAFLENPVENRVVSDFLVSRGFEVYPQVLDAAWHYVGFIDYPRYGFASWEAWLRRVAYRLGIKMDDETIKEWSGFYKSKNWKLYPDAIEAFNKAKRIRLKTAIVTSIAKFMYEEALKPISDKIDMVVDAFTFHCEKSNPKIYQQTLKRLDVKPEHAVMIGDEPYVDVFIPKKLGMHTIFLNRQGKTSRRLETKPDAIVSDLKEAMKIVESWT